MRLSPPTSIRVSQGTFPLMLGSTIPAISDKFYEEGAGLEEFRDYWWRIVAPPLGEYYLERRFFWSFRKLALYLTQLRFTLSRTRKDNVCFCECAWSIEKEVDGATEIPWSVDLFNDDIPEGYTDFSYTFDPPIWISRLLCFNLRVYLGAWSTSAEWSSELKVSKCFLESRL